MPNDTRIRKAGVLNLRRKTDLSILIFACCAAGLIFGFAQTAMAGDQFTAENKKAFCSKTYSEVEKSGSAALKHAVRNFRGKNHTNKTDTTHLKFADSDRIEMLFLSTTSPKGGELEKLEGIVEICENEGHFTFSSPLYDKPLIVLFEGECFRVGGVAGAIKGDKVNFCPGKMPPQIQVAIDRDENSRILASQPKATIGIVRQ